MQNFNTIEEAKKYAVDYFYEHHDYVGEFDYWFNNKGAIQFFSIDSPNRYHTFICTVSNLETIITSN